MAQRVYAKVISQQELKKGCFRMKLETASIAKEAIPGQFIHIRCGDSTDPLLRRPLSIHRIGKRGIELLYSVVGKGTRILSRKKAGDTVDIIGPLGNGYKIHKDTKTLKVLVAGGMGVAPLLALAEGLAPAVKGKKKFVVILGAKTRNHILCEQEFKNLGAEVLIATEDGSRGKKALATELVQEIIASRRKREEICLYAAGPMAMVKALCRLSEACSLESQVSLEERMACGLGACLGCVVDTEEGYKRVCKDGPVFNIRKVRWEQR